MTNVSFKMLAAAVVSAFALGSTLTYWHLHDDTNEVAQVGAYYCPMHPHIVSDHPDHCPLCGMELVPAKEQSASEMGDSIPQDAVHIDARMMQSMGVRLAPVAQGRLAKEIRMPATVQADPLRLTAVVVRSMGWLTDVQSVEPGTPVTIGQVLATLHSPELLASQEEYLQALNNGNSAWRERSRQRLLDMGMPPEWLDTVGAKGTPLREIKLRAPRSGVIVSSSAVQGAQVMAGTTLYSIADFSEVLVVGKAYAEDWEQIRLGDSLTIVSGEIHRRGKLDLLYPEVDAASQTMAVRAHVRNPGTRAGANSASTLRPGQNAWMIAHHEMDSSLVVPLQAILRTGKRDVAFVSLGKGWFAPREVRLGVSSGDSVQVLQGLQAGDTLVLSGQFLIDAESNLRQAIGRLSSEK